MPLPNNLMRSKAVYGNGASDDLEGFGTDLQQLRMDVPRAGGVTSALTDVGGKDRFQTMFSDGTTKVSHRGHDRKALPLPCRTSRIE
jgi:hypothetical protein